MQHCVAVQHSVTISQEKSYWKIVRRSSEGLKPSQLGSRRVRVVILIPRALSVIERETVLVIQDVTSVAKEDPCCGIISKRQMC